MEPIRRYRVKLNEKQEYAARWYKEILNNPDASEERKDFAAQELSKIGNSFQIKTLTKRLNEAQNRIARLLTMNEQLRKELAGLRDKESSTPPIPNSLRDLIRQSSFQERKIEVAP
jgi:hypothetical protein